MRYSILGIAVAVGVALTGSPASAQQEKPQEKTPMAHEQMTFEMADENSDGQISKDEFYGTLNDAGIYASWDTDRDGFIDENEMTALGFTKEFRDSYEWDLDADGYVDAGELYEGVYMNFDRDESGHWDGDEWDDAGEAGFWDV